MGLALNDAASFFLIGDGKSKKGTKWMKAYRARKESLTERRAL